MQQYKDAISRGDHQKAFLASGQLQEIQKAVAQMKMNQEELGLRRQGLDAEAKRHDADMGLRREELDARKPGMAADADTQKARANQMNNEAALPMGPKLEAAGVNSVTARDTARRMDLAAKKARGERLTDPSDIADDFRLSHENFAKRIEAMGGDIDVAKALSDAKGVNIPDPMADPHSDTSEAMRLYLRSLMSGDQIEKAGQQPGVGARAMAAIRAQLNPGNIFPAGPITAYQAAMKDIQRQRDAARWFSDKGHPAVPAPPNGGKVQFNAQGKNAIRQLSDY